MTDSVVVRSSAVSVEHSITTREGRILSISQYVGFSLFAFELVSDFWPALLTHSLVAYSALNEVVIDVRPAPKHALTGLRYSRVHVAMLISCVSCNPSSHTVTRTQHGRA